MSNEADKFNAKRSKPIVPIAIATFDEVCEAIVASSDEGNEGSKAMGIDLSKLTPAPWTAPENIARVYGNGERDLLGVLSLCPHLAEAQANSAFIALARNAFDVMLRRGWGLFQDSFGKWVVGFSTKDAVRITGPSITADDPFTALVEADKWYRENVEKGATS